MMIGNVAPAAGPDQRKPGLRAPTHRKPTGVVARGVRPVTLNRETAAAAAGAAVGAGVWQLAVLTTRSPAVRVTAVLIVLTARAAREYVTALKLTLLTAFAFEVGLAAALAFGVTLGAAATV